MGLGDAIREYRKTPAERRADEQRAEWQLREDIKYRRRLESEAKRDETAAQRDARRAAERRAAEAKSERKAKIEEYKKAELAARPPLTRRVGGTREVKVVTVTHHLLGGFPVALLPPHEARTDRVVFAADVMLDRDPSKQHDVKFMDNTAAARPLFEEIVKDYGSLLSKLRDHAWWDSLCDSVGVTLTKDAAPRPWKGTYASGVQKVTLIHSPVIMGMKVATDGLRIRIRARVGDGAGRWSSPSKIDLLRSAFQAAGVNARDLNVIADARGNIVLAFGDRDPLAEPLPSVITPYDAERGRSYLGKAADGSDVFLTWNNNAGVLIAGMTGAGKTQSLLPVIAGMVGEAEVHIFDGKASNAWVGLKPMAATYDASGDPSAPLEFLGTMHDVARERLARLLKETGKDEFWDVPVAQRRAIDMYPIIILFEEAPEYIGTEVEDKKLSQATAARSARGMKLWRAAGIIQVPVTQKTTNDQIPALIRANSSQKICFRQTDIECVKSMFGGEVSPSPMGDIKQGQAGRFVASVDVRGPVLGQAPYVPREDITAYLRTAKPVPSQCGKPAPAPAARTVSDVDAMTDTERAEAVRREAIRLGLIPADPDDDETGFDL